MQRVGLVWLCLVSVCFALGVPPERVEQLKDEFARFSPAAARRAIDDLSRHNGAVYDAARHRTAVDALAARSEEVKTWLDGADAAKFKEAEALIEGVRAALLANPLLDFDQILMVRRTMDAKKARRDMHGEIGCIALNSHNHVTIRKDGWNNDIVRVSGLRGTPKLETVYRPADGKLVRDIELDFDAGRLLFTGVNANMCLALFACKPDGSGVTEVTPSDSPDVDWFDGCYLPDGRIIMLGTAAYQGLPCENGSKPMALLYLLDPASGSIRQLTFEQDSDYTPTVMNDGRVLYTRWEYSDIPHYWSRILMTMNPDGTGQLALYGSGSYFPTALLGCRPMPGNPHKVVGIVSGHHDYSEIGRMVIIDPTLARSYPFVYDPPAKSWGPEGFSPLRIKTEVLSKEKTGMVYEFPGYGQPVQGDVCDGQVQNQFERGKPYFVYPFPLSDSYVLVSAKTKRDGLWGLYLADVFDNLTLVAELEGAALLEPVPLTARKRPPVIPDRITPKAKTASVHIADIYNGPGLRNVPRGTAKKIRIFSYHFAYEKTGGHTSVGLDGVESSWDVKRVLGTVDIEPDGSACFEIPANTPVSLQPLDADGAALQLMRSWLVGMPGERVSCMGCHEDSRSSVVTGRAVADTRPMQTIQPFQGPARPFGFENEVWPLAQTYCLGCHGDEGKAPPRAADQGGEPGKNRKLVMRNAEESYRLLHPYVRRPGPESELPMHNPLEWHGSTSALVQMLKKGHHGVTLDGQAWQTLYTWIDLNAPWRGKWGPPDVRGHAQAGRRVELSRRFAQVESNPESEYDAWAAAVKSRGEPAPVAPQPEPEAKPDTLAAPNFPMIGEKAKASQAALGVDRREVKLPSGEVMLFVRIPAGSFVMGANDGAADERPRAVVTIEKPFWMSETEVKNSHFKAFDPDHDSRYQDQHGKDHTFPGYISNHRDQPAIRLSWQRASDFCQWLGTAAGVKAALPTEAQWEWAARGGTDTRFYWGGLDDDFGKSANLADQDVRWSNVSWQGGSAIQKRNPYDVKMNYPLHEERFKDNWHSMDYVAQCAANAWGLKDMIGNASEWTRSSYRPYPYSENDGRNSGDPGEAKVARGGSFASRPRDAGATVRYAYAPWQGVFDVGFRVILED